jgi:hypothetical protein
MFYVNGKSILDILYIKQKINRVHILYIYIYYIYKYKYIYIHAVTSSFAQEFKGHSMYIYRKKSINAG